LVIEYKENFKLIFNSSSDAIFDSDLVTNEVIISDAYEKEFGYKITSHMTIAANWASHIHPDDKEAVMKDYSRILRTHDTEWKYNYRFLRADNSVASVIDTSVILRNAWGKAYRMIGSIRDISKQTVLEERLEQEIKLKEKKIAEAMEDAKDAERSEIGRELHDNINQLLGVSKLYLDMAKRGGENTETNLSRSSEFTMKAIDEIRKLTKGLTTDIIKNLGLCEAIESIARDTMQVNRVKIVTALESFIEEGASEKFKLTVYRIIQEQLNNILKHAKASEVIIRLSQDKKLTTLTITDNGVGFDTSKKRKGIGVDNIKSRAIAVNGTANFVSKPNSGCTLSVTFDQTTAPVTNS
jgi:two-component system sensor histidine kinase UhpB